MNDPRSVKGAHPELEAANRRIKELEEQLTEKDHRVNFLEQIIDNLPVGVQVFDVDGRSTRFNPALTKLLGLPEGIDKDAPLNMLDDPFMVKSGAAAAFTQALKTDEVQEHIQQIDFNQSPLPGTRRSNTGYFNFTLIPLKDSSDSPVSVIAVCNEVTSIVHDREVLARNEQRLQAIFNNLIVGIVVTDDEGRLIDVNAAMKDLLLYEEKELLGKHYEDITHPGDRAGQRELISPVYSGEKESCELEKRYIRKDGKIIWIQLFISAIRNEQGEVANLVGIFFDITKRKEDEEKLRESEQRLRVLFDNLLAGISITDLDGHYLMVNNEFARIFGYSLQELAELDVTALSYPEDLERDLRLTGELIHGKRDHYRIERRIIRKDGSTGWVDLTVRLIYDGEGRPLRFFAVMLDVTEQRAIKSAHKKSEEQMRTVFDNAVAGIVLTDATGRVVFANPSFTDMLGYDRNSLTGEPLTSFTHPDDLDWEEKLLKRVVEKRISNARFEKRYLKKDGGCIWADASIAVILNEQGRPHNFIAVVKDITLKKVAEKELKATEERWRTAFEKVGDGVWLWNMQNNDLYLSPSWKAMIGFEDHELPNEFSSFEGRVHPDDVEKIYQQLGRHIKGTDEKYRVEFRLRAKNGSYVWILARGRILETNKEGEPLRIIGTHTDLTDRIEAELRLQESEQLQKTLIGSLHNGLLMIDRDGRIIEYNTAAARILGFPVEEKGIYKISELSWGCIWQDGTSIDPEKRPMLTPLQSGESVRDVVVGIFNAQDRRIWLNINSEPLFHPGDTEPYAVVVSFSDITREKENEQRLAELVATKDRFFSIIAHDLKTPFHALLGLSKMLTQKKGGDKESIDKISEMIHRSSKQSFSLLNNLLEWSRTQTGRIKFEPEQINLYGVAKEISGAMQAAAEMKEAAIELQLKEDTTVFADRNMLDSIIRNLISNALKYSRQGGMVLVRAKQLEGFVRISVRDYGVGIDAERLKLLFRIDHKISTPGTDKEPGTGLGLILCKDFVEKHGGTILAESEPGKGSTFTFTLPSGPLE